MKTMVWEAQQAEVSCGVGVCEQTRLAERGPRSSRQEGWPYRLKLLLGGVLLALSVAIAMRLHALC